MGREIQPRGLRSVPPFPPQLSTGAPRPSWPVSTACPSSTHAPASPRLLDEVGCGSSGTPTRSPASSPPPQPKLTPQEKLKLRMQKALNRQCMSRHLPLQGSPAPPPSGLAVGRPCPLPDRRPFGEEWVCTCPAATTFRALAVWLASLSSASASRGRGLEGTPHHCVPLPTVKADKKAAQEKMIQQEHERQVRVGVRAQGSQGCRPGPALTAILPSCHPAISAVGAGRRASSHGPQDPYEVRPLPSHLPLACPAFPTTCSDPEPWPIPLGG